MPILLIGQTNKKENPFSFETSYIGDALINIDGGIEQGSTFMGMANLIMHFDTEKGKLWKGGELCINASHTHGGEATTNLIGDFQTASNIEAGNLTYMYEMWYKQTFDKVSITIGLQDLNAEFVSNDFGAGLINSSFGIPSTFAANIPSPIFPNTEYGIAINWQIYDWLTFQSSIFKCDEGDFEKNPYNLKSDFKSDKNYQIYNELNIHRNIFLELPGVLKLGSYYYKNHNVGKDHSNNYGFYLLAEQIILKQNNGVSRMGVFTQASYSANNFCDNPLYLGLGCNYKAISIKRPQDELSFGIAYAKLNNNIVNRETVFELNYLVQFTENISVKPDLQYVINPAGTNVKLANALIAMLRFELNF